MVVALGVAFHYSILTLLRGLSLETPLAYLGLVPLIALVLAALKARPSGAEVRVNDRQVDWIVGLPLIVAATLVLVVLPATQVSAFWPLRLDILALPLFAAGTVSLLFGTRMLGRLKAPIIFLFLAWPWPYKAFLGAAMDRFTEATVSGVAAAVKVWPVAERAVGGDGSSFEVVHQGRPFALSIASACAGVNGVVGFFIVGTAFLLLVRGRRVQKLAWLGIGLGLIWLLNLVRILLLFVAGRQFGQSVAIDGLHPFIGLVTFSLGVVAMIVLLPRFGLNIPVEPINRAQTAASLRRAVPKPAAALGVVTAVALVLGFANAGLRTNELTTTDLGDPRLLSFSESPVKLPGWSSVMTNVYEHGKPYFGKSSTWQRFQYYGPDQTVIADVIETGRLRAFQEYTVEACYGFHKYDLLTTDNVNLGGGVLGQTITFRNGDQQWSTLNWVWPVKVDGGTRFERVTLFARGSGTVPGGSGGGLTPVRGLGGAVENVLRSSPDGKVQPEVRKAETFLTGLATAIVKGQEPAPTSPS